MVELLIAMSIATTLVAGILASYTYLARNLIRYSFEQQLEAESRRALQMITQDVRAAVDAAASDYTANRNNRTNQITLTMPDGSTVQYTFDTTAGTLTRVAAGTSLTLFSTVSILPVPTPPPPYQGFFCCLDQLDIPAANQQGIRKIEIGGFTATLGTDSSGTQTGIVSASARLVLRNKRPSS
jgi:type II secretory pathway pseudopilin PulG